MGRGAWFLRPVILYFLISFVATRDVIVDLEADWADGEFSLFLETAEYLFMDGKIKGSSYISQIIASNEVKSTHGNFLEQMDDAERMLLTLSLDFRAMSPKIEFNKRAVANYFPEECNSVGLLVIIDGSVFSALCDSDVDSEISLIEKSKNLSSSQCASSDTCPEQTLFLNNGFEYLLHISRDFQEADPGSGLILVGSLGSDDYNGYMTRLQASQIQFNLFACLINSFKSNYDQRVRLRGWSSALDIKNTEYLTINEDTKVHSFGKQTKSTKKYDFSDISLQVVQTILGLSFVEGLEKLISDLQYFPLVYKQYLKVEVQPSLKHQIETKQFSMEAMMRPDLRGKLYVNGLPLPVGSESFNVFSFIKTLKKEFKVINGLKRIGLSNYQIGTVFNVLYATDYFETGWRNPKYTAIQESLIDSKGEIRLNMIENSKGNIIFFNNLEKERRYKNAGYTKDLNMLLQPLRQVATVRKNIFTIVAFLDLGSTKGKFLLDAFQALNENLFPVRLGIVLTKDDGDESICSSKCFLSLFLLFKAEFSKKLALSMIPLVVGKPIEEAVEFLFNALYMKGETISKELLQTSATSPSSTVVNLLFNMTNYGIEKRLSTNMFLLNGRPLHYDEGLDVQEFYEFLSDLVFEEQRTIAELIWSGAVTGKSDVLRTLLNPKKETVVSTYSPIVMESKDDRIFLQLDRIHDLIRDSRTVATFGSGEELLIWHANFCSDHENLIEVLSAMQSKNIVLIMLGRSACARALSLHIHNKQDSSDMKVTLSTFDENLVTTGKELETEYSLFVKEIYSAYLETVEDTRQDIASQDFIVYNGRFIVLESFDGSEVDVLVESSESTKVKQLMNELIDANPDVIRYELSSMLSNIEKGSSKRGFIDRAYYGEDFCYNNDKNSLISFMAEVDPMSNDAYQVLSIINLFRKKFEISVSICFTPKVVASESLPVPRFTLSAFEADKLNFTGLPKASLLSMKIFSPEPWIVGAHDTSHVDIDNLLLEQLPEQFDNQLRITFRLQNMLVTGHSYEVSTNKPTTGVQLQLVDIMSSNTIGDTVVMKNLGYFQIKAYPGIFDLEIIPSEKSLGYKMKSVDIGSLYSKGDSDRLNRFATHKSLAVLDFGDEVSYILMKNTSKSIGKALSNSGSSNEVGLWDNIKSYLSPFGVSTYFNSGAEKEEYNGTIHVFSIASGALYERFLKIMMFSVLSKTKNPVKFWIVGNFLSPTFSSEIECLSKTLDYYYINKLDSPEEHRPGFEYSLVTYRWPHWLNGQTEKQRIIWGYKILFLDVLFPLNVKKIVYVDADQIVRTDLKNLFEEDMKGKVYGFTPFCSDKKETLGFQFWRQGYWETHLNGRPYHISALFVVDLDLFRKRNIGDQLRQTYQQLSQDKNSLANLDQDLPNFAQHQIPIHSLDQSWLWCESWCSNHTKAKSKTIDLCNNPLHKEPKLSMAKRIISGDLFEFSWDEIDSFILSMTNECGIQGL